jgi:hypothetical protein
MTSNRRGLRSGSVAPASSKLVSSEPSVISSPITFTPTTTSPPQEQKPILLLPPTTKLPHLSPSEFKLLRKKKSKLRLTVPSTLSSLPDICLRTTLEASLIFAQHEAGTAVLIHPSGWVLTCAHCFGDSEEEYKADSKKRWLLFYTGDAVLVECRAWDSFRDLALLKIIAIESTSQGVPTFRTVKLYQGKMSYKMSILCIGQPGRDDLESKESRKTTYNLVEVSEGTFRGMVKGVDPQDNEDIGALMHDAWTYWGHSGAPLLREVDGLVGLHSSWDDGTAMRHGVPGDAIREFLMVYLPEAVDEAASRASVNTS